MSQEDMQQILAGLPVQMPGQPGPDLDGGPRFPPLTQDEINQIFANIPPQPRITPEEIDQIFARAPAQTMSTADMNQVFSSLPQQASISEEELNRIMSGNAQQSGQTFGTMPQYNNY